MQTAVISYRVADFLKQHPPFQYMEEEDLVGLAARGRVKFHEADEYIIWQEAAHGANIFVIQQGTVSIWEERAGTGDATNGDKAGGEDTLRDIRGAGDLLGIDRFAGAEKSLYSAKSSSDVVVYAFPASDFAQLAAKYPAAGQYLSAAAHIGSEYQTTGQRRDAAGIFLYDVARGKQQKTCLASRTIRDAVIAMRASGREAIAVLNDQKQLAGVLTSDHVLRWIEEGGSDSSQPVADLILGQYATAPCTIPPDASVSECVLGMASANTMTAAITERGDAASRLHGLVTAGDLAPVFGEQPSALLGEIQCAPTFEALRDLNQRVRAFVFENLAQSSSIDWLGRFAHLADNKILERIITLTSSRTSDRAPKIGAEGYCWCFTAAAGRKESLTLATPSVVLLFDPAAGGAPDAAAAWFHAVQAALEPCGYLAQPGEASTGSMFGCASIEEWDARFRGWLENPIENDIYVARPMFDLAPFAGDRPLYQRLAERVSGGVTKAFLYLLANDCLSNLPPLTFFRDAVVHGSGEQSDVFDLEHNALDPLVDVGRVFGIASRNVLGASTLSRFALAKALLPEQELIFREASETLRAVLFHQTRVGIRQRTDGSKLPPALLSRHDRQVLKHGFRSILKLLEFTAECQWLERL